MTSCSLRVFFCLLAVSCTSLGCSAPYSEASSVCMFVSTTILSWCDAQHYCRRIGGELLTGDTALKAFPTLSLNSEQYWIGVTDLAEEQGSSRNGWRWSNGSVMPYNVPWNKNDTKFFINQDCLKWKWTNMTDGKCSQTKNFICQPNTEIAPIELQYTITNVFVSSTPDDFGFGACTKTIIVESDLECGRACFSEGRGDCASFYFHRERLECILMLFTDARLDLGNAAGWVKFIK